MVKGRSGVAARSITITHNNLVNDIFLFLKCWKNSSEEAGDIWTFEPFSPGIDILKYMWHILVTMKFDAFNKFFFVN